MFNSDMVKNGMFSGCYTALVTPYKRDLAVDYEGLRKIVDFQVEEGISGILFVGTTGESPTLTWEEHNRVTEKGHDYVNGRCLSIAGVGSNSTEEALEGSKYAEGFGIKTLLLVDPYYNGPSSLEIRREYVEPITRNFPEMQVIPYIIPGRTGTQLMPQDIAILHANFKNVNAVKEATGNLGNMKLTRKLCGPDFDILSGDDDITYEMMTSLEIAASGVISVTSNIAPRAVQQFTQALRDKRLDEAARLAEALKPLFQMVTVKTTEETPFGQVACKARNPLPYKTLMNIIGMPAGPCRPPLGKMTRKGLEHVLAQARTVYSRNPEILKPVEDHFDIRMEKRLYEERYWEALQYDEY